MRAEASRAVERAVAGERPRRRARPLPPDVRAELDLALDRPSVAKAAARLEQARQAFEAERYAEARRILVELGRQTPDVASVRELHGLTAYQMGRWREAVRELEAYRHLTGEVDQHPVLADSYRALHRYAKVDELWDELKTASPSAALVAEGRIVTAGALADQGRLDDALALMQGADRVPPRVRDHHLRLWYVTADLADRAGDAPRARALFRRIREREPDFADVDERLAALGS